MLHKHDTHLMVARMLHDLSLKLRYPVAAFTPGALQHLNSPCPLAYKIDLRSLQHLNSPAHCFTELICALCST